MVPIKASAFELGITPNQVHNLWININRTFFEIQKSSNISEDKLKKLTDIKLQNFSDKYPSDVYNLSLGLYDIVAREISPQVLRKYNSWINDFDIIAKTSNGEATPSMVYVLSSEILNLLVEHYLNYTLSKKPIGQFYQEHHSQGKSPNDVYAQVVLFKKRLQVILPDKVFAKLSR